MVRELLLVFLQHEISALARIALAETSREGLLQYREHEPDLIISELFLDGTTGPGMLESIRHEFPQARILIYTGATTYQILQTGRLLNPQGFVHKTDPITTLKRSLEAVLDGGSSHSPEIRRRLDGPDTGECLEFNPRQLAIISLIADGYKNEAIARQIGRSVKTVEDARSAIMQSIGTNHQAGLVAFAIHEGLVIKEVPSRTLP